MRWSFGAGRGVYLPAPWRTADGREIHLVAHDRRQMPVGQGGFHVGALRRVKGGEFRAPPFDNCARFSGAEFLYVYDCGSSPKSGVEKEIKGLLEYRPERKLDILFLSHFDVDHICGTPRLLGSKRRRAPGFSVDTIVLPYVDHAERLLAFARASTSALDGGRGAPDFFRKMVIDPGAALAAFGPRQIIFIEGDAPPGDEEAGVVPDPDLGPWSGSGPGTPHEGGLHFKVVESHGDAGHERAKSRIPQRPLRMRRLSWGHSAGTSSMLLAANIAFHVRDWGGTLGWRLLPHVRPASKAAVAAFERAAETELKWPSGDFRRRIGSVAVREQLVTKHRMKLARAYRAIFGNANKNQTSLSLYSGPANPHEVDGLAITPWLSDHQETKIGWLGTGDAPLKNPEDIFAFEQFYADEMVRVSSFMLLHHGSIENSNPGHLVSDADIYVAAADPRHDWEHPSVDLFRAVYNAKKLFAHVREQRQTAFDESFLVAWGEGRDEMARRTRWAALTLKVEAGGARLRMKGPPKGE